VAAIDEIGYFIGSIQVLYCANKFVCWFHCVMSFQVVVGCAIYILAECIYIVNRQFRYMGKFIQ
jgi:hypothetical protein